MQNTLSRDELEVGDLLVVTTDGTTEAQIEPVNLR